MAYDASPLQKTGRILLAAAVIVAGAIIGFYMSGGVERLIVTLSAGLFAIIILLENRSERRSNPQAAAPILKNEALAISQHPQFSPLINGIVDPVLVIAGPVVQQANRAARKLLGEHIVGEDIRLVIRHPSVADFISQTPIPETSRPIMLMGIGSRDQRWEMQVKKIGDGKRLLFLWDQSGSYAVDRMRTDFVANASHELRTPLSSIKGFIETLEDDSAGDDAELRTRFLGVMFGEAQRMQKLIDDLISLSRIESEKHNAPDSPVDLGELIREVREVFVNSPDMHGRDILVDITPDLPPTFGDRAQLSQLLHNLISNAVKYGRDGTPIAISLTLSRNGAMQRLVIADEGEGIAPEHLPRLTERFYRVDSGRSRSMGGTGLGLSIVKHIVERHRGRFDIASIPNKGTTITISLPKNAGVQAGTQQ
ncbi:ATP-binding protein [Sphingorhabdus sp. Alg239-R122]|uniref:ATP-binding protein n=1 Tax=Sphingorhabdus sp. Alg239-R122 TaxID=2305989 RepID=UPI001F07592E|nr:ATP-binding protein [Sphingorhabdus sp. Alg239-R122]